MPPIAPPRQVWASSMRASAPAGASRSAGADRDAFLMPVLESMAPSSHKILAERHMMPR
jgi:hypothetical protein